ETKEFFESNLLPTNKTKANRSSKEYSLGSGTSSSSMDDKEEKLSKEEVKDTSSFILVGEINDFESSSGSGGTNEPDSPPLSMSISNVVELERGKGSLKRKKSNRSIFSVLSLSNKDTTNKGSLSESEGDPLKTTSPKSPSKSERILGRSGFSSLSIRNRRSKSTISLDDKLHISLSPEHSKLGSSDIPEKTSKVGKLLGLTPMEERILLDKPSNGKINKKMRSPPASSIDEKNKINNQIIGGSSNKVNKILGVSDIHDDPSTLDTKSNKAGKILGWDDNEVVKKAYMEKVVSEFRSSRANVNSHVTVASIRNTSAFTGHLSKYINTNFVLSKSRSWKRRFFILTKNTLYCFKSSDSTAILMDSLELAANTIVCVSDAFNGRSWVLEVRKDNKPWYLQADNVEDMKIWLAELKATVVKYIFTTPKISMEIPPTVEKSSEENNKTYEQISLPPPPRPIPPPLRSKSRSPSPTTNLTSPIHPLSPHLIVNGDVEEFIGSPTKLDQKTSECTSRPSSPVETLSPPRTRHGQVIPNEHATYSDPNDIRELSHVRNDPGPMNIGSSISTVTPPRKRLSPPIKREERNSIRQSIPIIMPTNFFKTNQHNAIIGTSLPPPPRSSRSPPLIRSENSFTPEDLLSINQLGPPPSIPLPLPPPRPKCTITQNSVPRSRISNDTSRPSSYDRVKTLTPTRFTNSNLMSRTMIHPPPSLPPPTIPLPPIPAESTDNDISVTRNSTSVITETIIEYPDDDDLDPDYAEELEASRQRSQRTENNTSTTKTIFFTMSDVVD
ncbi:14560_t:CDS:2, partial [Ambispora leptoticha]